MAFTVAIVGRPNVGKSTLFNRLVGKKLALVDDQPGVTRDRRFGPGHLGDLDFTVVDTAGLEETFDESLEARMREQTEAAIRQADVALLLIDARAGVTPLDEHFAKRLRKTKTPVLLVANKCESRAAEAGLNEAFRLGLGAPIAISAEHGEGMGELYDALRGRRPQGRPKAAMRSMRCGAGSAAGRRSGSAKDPAARHRRATQCRQVDAGERLLGEERLLTGPEAGITRDSIAVDWQWKGTPIRLIDTAGLRRRARVVEKLERLSGADTDRAVRYAHVVVLVLDANDMLEKQDLTIARHVVEEGRALVIAANKWDAIEDKNEALKRLKERVEKSLPQVKGVPVVTLSARSGRNLDRLMQAVFKIYGEWNKRVPTAQLNRWLEAATIAHPPPLVRGRRIKLRYMTQIKTRPPTFALFAAKADDLRMPIRAISSTASASASICRARRCACS